MYVIFSILQDRLNHFFFRWSLYSRLYERGEIYDIQRTTRVGLLQIHREWIHRPSNHLQVAG